MIAGQGKPLNPHLSASVLEDPDGSKEASSSSKLKKDTGAWMGKPPNPHANHLALTAGSPLGPAAPRLLCLGNTEGTCKNESHR